MAFDVRCCGKHQTVRVNFSCVWNHRRRPLVCLRWEYPSGADTPPPHKGLPSLFPPSLPCPHKSTRGLGNICPLDASGGENNGVTPSGFGCAGDHPIESAPRPRDNKINLIEQVCCNSCMRRAATLDNVHVRN